MSIRFRCPSCGAGYKVNDKLAGHTVRCTKCGGPMRVPPAPQSSDSPPLAIEVYDLQEEPPNRGQPVRPSARQATLEATARRMAGVSAHGPAAAVSPRTASPFARPGYPNWSARLTAAARRLHRTVPFFAPVGIGAVGLVLLYASLAFLFGHTLGVGLCGGLLVWCLSAAVFRFTCTLFGEEAPEFGVAMVVVIVVDVPAAITYGLASLAFASAGAIGFGQFIAVTLACAVALPVFVRILDTEFLSGILIFVVFNVETAVAVLGLLFLAALPLAA